MNKNQTGGVSKLTGDQIVDISNAFTIIDLNKNGYILTRYLESFLTLLGQNLTQAELEELILEFDTEGEKIPFSLVQNCSIKVYT